MTRRHVEGVTWARCPVCWRDVALTSRRRFYRHRAYVFLGGVGWGDWCPGGGRHIDDARTLADELRQPTEGATA